MSEAVTVVINSPGTVTNVIEPACEYKIGFNASLQPFGQLDNPGDQAKNVYILAQPNIEAVLTPQSNFVLELSVGQGPSGPQGLPGISGGKSFYCLSEVSLSGHRVVLLNQSGKADYASSSNIQHSSRVIGITTGASSVNQQATIVTYGQMTEPSWSWDVSLPIYLGYDGVITQTAPSYPNSVFSLILGFPVSSNSIYINISNPIILTL